MPDTTELAELIAGDFYNDRFDLSARGMAPRTAWSLMPEVEVTQKLRVLGASGRAIRVFLTLVSAMDRARDATRLWRAAEQLFETHPEVFNPACVTSMAAEELSALLSKSRVSQRHRPDAAAWRAIARSLVSGVDAVSQAGGLRPRGRRGFDERRAAQRFRRPHSLSVAAGSEDQGDVGADHGGPWRGGNSTDAHDFRCRRRASAPRHREPRRDGHAGP